jgi:arylsulfatase
MKKTLFTIIFLLSAFALQAEPLRQILLISCDTLSAQHMQSYGYGQKTTTEFDKLAAKGTLFNYCIAPQGWTLTSHMSMFTGLEPLAHGVGKYNSLNEEISFLPEILSSAGFATGGFPTSNHWLDRKYGFDRGYDFYSFFMNDTIEAITGGVAGYTYEWLKKSVPVDNNGPTKPFFMMLHYMDAHSRPIEIGPYPYWSPVQQIRDYYNLSKNTPDMKLDDGQWDMSAYDNTELRKGYDSAIRTFDFYRLAPIIKLMTEGGYLDDTMIIITSDHGEEIGQHGGYYHDQPYGEVRHVPLLIVWPGHIEAGRRVQIPVSLADIMPTVLDFAELIIPSNLNGISLMDCLQNEEPPPKRNLLTDGHWRGFKKEPASMVGYAQNSWWSLIAETDTTGTVPVAGKVLGLYDLGSDQFERINMMDNNPGIVADFVCRMNSSWLKNSIIASSYDGETEDVEIDEETRRKLKSLGY